MDQPKKQVPAHCGNQQCSKGTSSDLLLCSACKQACYCSKDCQKESWKYHKSYCKHVTSSGASSTSLDALAYYHKIAAYDPGAQAVASDIGLSMPLGGANPQGISKPLRRLVITGKDTPKNLTLFFGQGVKSAEVLDTHKQNRLEVLLRPPPGSPSYVRSKRQGFDENCPPWAPREASTAEADELKKIRDMQETIRHHMGSRGVENIGTNDMRDILVKNFGNQWVDRLQICQVALNTMEQGVPDTGRRH